MKKNITQFVNKNGIEGYLNTGTTGIMIRAVIDSDAEIIVKLKYLTEAEFEEMDIAEVFELQGKQAN